MPKENVRKRLLKAKDLLKSAREEIDEALREIDEDDDKESSLKYTGYGYVGTDGTERVNDSEEYDEDED